MKTVNYSLMKIYLSHSGKCVHHHLTDDKFIEFKLLLTMN